MTTKTTTSSVNKPLLLVDFFAFLPPGQHPGMDALARGLAAGVQERGGTLRLRCHATVTNDVLRQAAQGGAHAIYLFVTHPHHQPSASVVQEIMQSTGTAIYTIHRPWYPVTASVVVPNFYQGVTLANRLAQELYNTNSSSSTTSAITSSGSSAATTGSSTSIPQSKKKKIAILGGPAIVDDEELVLGCLDGAQRAQLHVLNDPMNAAFRNLKDVKGASQTVVQHLFDKHGADMQGLIVFNDETLHDVIDYLQKSPKHGHLLGTLPIVSRNGSPTAVAWVKQGWTTATLDYHLPEIGRLAASLLDDIHQHTANGKNASNMRLVMAPLGTLYDKHNVNAYVSWETRAPAADTPLVVISQDDE